MPALQMAATILLVEGVRWGSQQSGASASLSSLQRSGLGSSPNCGCACPASAPVIMCSSSSNLFDRLDPPLPRFPSHQQSMKGYEVSRSRVVVEEQSGWQLLYVDESSSNSRDPPHSEPWNNLEQPSSPRRGDIPNKVTSFRDGQGRDIRRTSPSYMSISRSRRATSHGSSSQLVPTPLRNRDIKGASGFYVGFAAVMLWLAAIMRKGGLLGTSSSTGTLCTTCDGYGMKLCNLCKGNGSVAWEGKLRHVDLCPLCFGGRIRKCADCGGYCSRSDEPPFSQLISMSKSSKAWS